MANALLPSFQNYMSWGGSKLLFLRALSKHVPAHPGLQQPPREASHQAGEPQPPWYRWRQHCLSSAPQPMGSLGAAWSRLLNRQHLMFPSHTQPWVCQGPTALPPPVGAAACRRAAPCSAPEEPRGCLGMELHARHAETVLFLLLVASFT